MSRRIVIKTVLILVILTRFMPGAKAQKANHHCYTNVRGWALQTIGWGYKDFAAQAVNPDQMSSLTVQFKFTAQDPTFRFWSCDPLPCGYKETGSARRDKPAIPAYADSAPQIAVNINTPDQLFPGTSTSEQYDFTGTVEVYALGYESSACGDSTPGTPLFYSQNVFNLSTPAGGGPTKISAFKTAWGGYNQYTDVYWDTALQRHLALFANFFFNMTDWDYGWQTTISVTNQSNPATDVNYTVFNHIFSGKHSHATNCLQTVNEGYLTGTFFVGASSTRTIDPFREMPSQTTPYGTHVFYDPPSLNPFYWEHDTALSMSITPLVGGILPSVHVYPNTSNNYACVK